MFKKRIKGNDFVFKKHIRGKGYHGFDFSFKILFKRRIRKKGISWFWLEERDIMVLIFLLKFFLKDVLEKKVYHGFGFDFVFI